MSKYLVSIDIAKTQTDISVYDNSDGSVAMFTFGVFDLLEISNSIKIANDSFLEIYNMLSITKNDIKALVIATDDIEQKENAQKLILELEFEKEQIFALSKAELLLLTISKKPAIAVISSKGSLCLGYDEEELVRCGGHGAMLSELGSGYWIGMQILREYIKYTDDQVPYLPIYDEVEASLGEVEFSKISQEEIAKTAKIVLDYAESGNELCKNIIDAGAYNLAQMTKTVFTKLLTNDALSIDVLMIGDMFESDNLKQSFISQCIAQTNYNNFNFIVPTIEIAECGIEFIKKVFN